MARDDPVKATCGLRCRIVDHLQQIAGKAGVPPRSGDCGTGLDESARKHAAQQAPADKLPAGHLPNLPISILTLL